MTQRMLVDDDSNQSGDRSELSTTIRMLGDLLGHTIIEQEGQKIFDLEEEIRGLSKARRSGDDSAQKKIVKRVPKLVNDIGQASAVLKAFTTYFQLVNLAEEQERGQVLRRRALEAESSNTPMDESLDEAISKLHAEGMTAPALQAVLNTLYIVPVFTAHPTESKRKTILLILKHISGLLKESRKPNLLASERDDIVRQIHEYIVLLWQSDETRNRRPTVMDEVRNNGLYFFENTLFNLVPRIYDELTHALIKYYPGERFDIPPFLRYGSWIGGDRDGNPFVTLDVTREALKAQKESILERYNFEIDALFNLLSSASTRVNFSDELLASIDQDLANFSSLDVGPMAWFDQEPYRKKLYIMFHRLRRNRAQNQQPWGSQESDSYAYRNAEDFLSDLRLIDTSLRQNKGSRLAEGRLSRLIRMVEIFGFHLATLDVRQHSERHRSALGELLRSYEIVYEYDALSENDKVKLLSEEISSLRPFTALLDDFTGETIETLRLFRLIRQAHDEIGVQSIQTYIISMTTSVSHVLEVLLFAKDAGLFGQLDIVPLFETVDDLLNAPAIMTELFTNPIYQKHLESRGNSQQIMIGYSDSNKDGGYLRASWMLYRAQQTLAQTCEEHEVRLTLFHGRGGSISRGGGPANRAILAQPPNSTRGRIKVTEQGEVVSSRYSDSEIAHRHLEQLVSAALLTCGNRPTYDQEDVWSEAMDELSQLAYLKYRSLVEKPEFIPYFHQATPIEQIGHLNIGSRPAKRRETTAIDDLRAIPWVFAWLQTRVNLPSWYGVGSGLESWIDQAKNKSDQKKRVSLLQEMYKQWPFFRTMLDNVQMGLAKADMDIASLYADLCSTEMRTTIFENVRTEHERSVRAILLISGQKELLDNEGWLQHSIRVRNPYVDPLNYIQVALLDKLRSETDPKDLAKLRDALLLSVNGIAAGIQNVG